MPKTTDQRVIIARQARNMRIRKRFAVLFDKGLRYEIVMDKLISEFGISESTINQIVKGYGGYQNT